MSAEYALDTLRFDANNRYPGITCDLHPIEEWHAVEWKGELPTITARKPFKLGVKNSREFKKKLLVNFPEFEDFEWKNICIAGGMVSLLLGETIDVFATSEADLDFFVYGVDSDEDFYKVVEHAMQQLDGGDIIGITRTPRFIMYVIGERKYQFILRHYSSVSEILHSFDLGSSAVAFDGKHVVATSLGKFAFETSCNIINLERYSPSFEFRLVKYWYRGFSIVLPNLKREVLDVPPGSRTITLGKLSIKIYKYGYNVDAHTTFESDYKDEGDDLTYPALYSFLSNAKHCYISIPEAENPSDAWMKPIPFTREELEEAIYDVTKRFLTGNLKIRRVKKLGLIHLLDSPRSTQEYELARWKERLLATYDAKPECPEITRVSTYNMLGSFDPLTCDVRAWYGEWYQDM